MTAADAMSYELTFTSGPSYLHVLVTGRNTRENVQAYLQEVARECTQRGCARVLIEERLEGPRLDMRDVFRIASDGSRRAQGAFTAIAYVDTLAQGDLMQFAGTVAANRSVPVRVFATVGEARTSLESSPPAGA